MTTDDIKDLIREFKKARNFPPERWELEGKLCEKFGKVFEEEVLEKLEMLIKVNEVYINKFGQYDLV